MWARKLIYRLMVLAPAMFLAGLTLHARTSISDFDTVADDLRHENQILAYVPYLRDSNTFLDRNTRADAAATRAAAIKWIQGGEKGELVPLNPIAYEDTSTEGPKSQVFDVSNRIVRRLGNFARNEVEAGQIHQAVLDTVLAVRLANVLKFSDFLSMFNCATEQRRALQQIEPALNKLSNGDRAMLKACLAGVDADPKVVAKMLSRSKSFFMEWRKRRGYNPLSIEDTQLLSDIPALVKDGNAVALKEIKDRMFASNDEVIPTFCSAVRLGIGAQQSLCREAESTLKTLNTKEASL